MLYDVTCESSFVNIRDWMSTIEVQLGLIDNSPYRQISDLGSPDKETEIPKKNLSKCFARNTIMRKSANFKAIFPTHYNIFQPNFGILLLLKGSFRECSFLVGFCIRGINFNTWPV